MTTIEIMLGFICVCELARVVKTLCDWKADIQFSDMMNAHIKELEKKSKKK